MNTTTTTNLQDNAVKASIDALNTYRETEGPQKGLINSTKIDIAICDAMSAYFKERRLTPEELVNLKMDAIGTKAFAELITRLHNQVWTGGLTVSTKTVIAKTSDGQEVPIERKEETPRTTSPRCGINYEDLIFRRIQPRLFNEYTPCTPTLTHSPDAKRFLEICRDLFPNVASPLDCAKALRDFIENVHHSCKTPGAKFIQKAMWLYSLKTGGTGKSRFLIRLGQACEKLGIDTKAISVLNADYIDPSFGLHTVVISEETPRLESSLAEVFNKIIDHSQFPYNIKYGAAGTAPSFANMAFGSNYVSFESNTRRYNQVEFVQYNLEDTMTEEERTTYFPHWGDEDWELAQIVEAFKVAPFKSEVPTFNLTRKDTFEIDPRYTSIAIAIKETVDARNYLHAPVDKMRITEFAKVMENEGLSHYHDNVAALRNFISELKSLGKLPSRACAGRTKVEYFYFDWNKIAALVNDTVDDSDFFASIREEWNNLIKEFTGLHPTPPTGTDPKEDSDTTSVPADPIPLDKIPEANYFSQSSIDRTQDPANCQFEVLNPIDPAKAEAIKQSGVNKTGICDDSAASRRNFIFECDDAPLEWQIANANKLKGTIVNRAVHSGGKSVHCRVTIDFEPEDKAEYKRIWHVLNDKFFSNDDGHGLADEKCANPTRLTRRPNAYRVDKEAVQELLFEYDSIFRLSECSSLMDKIYSEGIKESFKALSRPITSGEGGNGTRLNSQAVTKFLNTSFLNGVSHGGEAHSSFYKAVVACLGGNDQETLDMVVSKARLEGWSSSEINDSTKRAEKYLGKEGGIQ